jgi:hypothetical protein
MIQSGHSQKDGPNYKMLRSDYALTPVKPVLDGEPRYENHPVRGDETNTQWFDDFDVRQAAYWAVFSGAFGHTYGCHDIWMMYDGTRERQCADAWTPWKKSIDLPGAWQMLILRNFLLNEKLLAEGHIPCQELLVGDNPEGTGYMAVCCTKDRKRAFVYVPTGRQFKVDISQLQKDAKLSFTWFNPRTGNTTLNDDVARKVNGDLWEFDPPGEEERGNDWVLLLSIGLL